MTSAFRLSPAAGRLDRALHRPRVVRLLAGRFQHRLSLMQAPAGAGKSTALALAIESNELDPLGRDYWLGLEAGDNNVERLLDGLCRAVGLEVGVGVEATLGMVLDSVWRQAPTDVVLILDDVHLITSEPALTLIGELIVGLPTNGHVLLAGRSTPRIPTARLRAQHELLEIQLDALEFDDQERVELLAMHPPGELTVADLPRHAALAELRLVAGPGAQADYLEEEVLDSLDAERLQGLAKLALLGEFDDELSRALTRGAYGANEVVEGLPLVEEATAGWFRLHALLRTALREHLSDGQAQDVLRVAARVEESRDNLVYAAELLAAGGDADGAVDLARRFIARSTLRRTLADLGRIRLLLAAEHSGSALLGLIEQECQNAQIGRGVTSPEVTRALEDVAKAAAAEADSTVEAVALFRALSGHNVDVTPAPPWIHERLNLLSSSGPLAEFLYFQAQCAEQTRRGNVVPALALVNAGQVFDPVSQAVLRSVRFSDLGRPEDVGEALTPGDLAGLPPGAEVVMAFAMWLRGDASPEFALDIVSGMVIQTLPRQVVENSVSLLGVASFVALAAGDSDAALRFVSRGEALLGPGAATKVQQVVALGRAGLASLVENDAMAADLLASCLEGVPLASWPSRHYMVCLSFIYLAAPESRVLLSKCDFGRSLSVSVQAGQALVALRDEDSVDEAAALPWLDVNLLRVQVLPHHLCELAIAAMVAGIDESRTVFDQLPNLPLLLSRVASESNLLVQAAAERQLLRFPAAPPSKLSIVALGSLELWRDGERVGDEDWTRRKRVRELLGFMVERRTVERVDVATALWPNLDRAKAAGNLRVNLAHLQRVLEPNRPQGVAPFYLQADGERLYLHRGVAIDVDLFEAELGEASEHDRAGAPAAAYKMLIETLQRYGGPYLVDFDAVWCEDNRVRFDSLALGAFCRVGELTAAKGEPEQAMKWALRAMQVSQLSERAGRLLANCLLALGDRPGALQVLTQLQQRLEGACLSLDGETRQLRARLSL